MFIYLYGCREIKYYNIMVSILILSDIKGGKVHSVLLDNEF